MAFRLPSGLAVGEEYTSSTDAQVMALENSLPSGTRMLVGVQYASLPSTVDYDVERINAAIEAEGISPWPEYSRLATVDPDGEPIIWISYSSSPAWWMIIGGIMLLPILAIIPLIIMVQLVPGLMDMIMLVVMIVIMVPVFKMMRPGKEEKKEKPKEGG